MISENLLKHEIGRGDFRWRGNEITRIEGLSDAVFAFAITLLVVSLEVPKTFNELVATMRGFGAFAICFTLLFVVWYNQYKFFRRYGLQDAITVVLSGALLFVVLFYVYPLKFLFTALVERIFAGRTQVLLPNGNVEAMIEGQQMGSLMLVFGAGYFAVFAVFVLLYLHAYRKRRELQLNEVEIFDTRTSIQEGMLNCLVAALSIAMIVLGGAKFSGLAGMTYMLTGVVLAVHGVIRGKQRGRLEKASLQQS